MENLQLVGSVSNQRTQPVRIKDVFLQNLILQLLSFISVSMLNHEMLVPTRVKRQDKKWMAHNMIIIKSCLWHLTLPSPSLSSFWIFSNLQSNQFKLSVNSLQINNHFLLQGNPRNLTSPEYFIIFEINKILIFLRIW